MRAVLLVASLLAALAPGIARAQDELDRKFELAEKLGSGSFKDVYAVKGRPDLVVGIQHGRPWGGFTPEQTAAVLPEEKAMLDRIAATGTPTATILEIGTWNGDRAYVQKRFATGNRAPDWETTRWRVLNETTLDDVRKIVTTLKAAHMDVADAQFLVGEDGHVVVADPLGIVDRDPSGVAGVLHGIASDAEQAIAKRRLDALKTIPAAQDSELRPYFETTSPTAYGADGQARLHDALVKFLETGTDGARSVARAVRSGALELRILEHGTVVPLESAANQVTVWLGGTFPKLAGDLVREGARRLHGAESSLERAIVGAAHAVDFLRAKEVPEDALRSGTGDYELPLPAEPTALVDRLAGEHAIPAAEHARLVASARAILTRGERPVGAGMTRVLGERLREATEPRAEVER